jgi:hypothetical protein
MREQATNEAVVLAPVVVAADAHDDQSALTLLGGTFFLVIDQTS